MITANFLSLLTLRSGLKKVFTKNKEKILILGNRLLCVIRKLRRKFKILERRRRSWSQPSSTRR
jgi:hypothetical protein